MKIIVIGSSNTFYVRSYLDGFLKSNKFDVHYINTNINFFYQDSNLVSVFNYSNKDMPDRNNFKSKLILKIKKLATKLGLEDSYIQRLFTSFIRNLFKAKKNNALINYIKNINPDYIFCFWGDTLRHEINLIQQMNINAKTVLSINTYPTSFNFCQEKISQDDNRYFQCFDGLIFPSQLMLNFFIDNSILIEQQKHIVNPDYIRSEKCINKKTFNGLNKVIFLGNVNFTSRGADDIREDILKLAKCGIKVYIQEINENHSRLLHENIKSFPPFSYDEIKAGMLTEYINKNFDAVYYGYNSSGSLREKLSITTRFSLCEFANIPVIMEKNKFLALESEFNDSIDFILFENITDLSRDININKKTTTVVNRYHHRENKLLHFLTEVL